MGEEKARECVQDLFIVLYTISLNQEKINVVFY